MIEDLGNGIWRWECSVEGCGAYAQGNDPEGIQYQRDQHVLTTPGHEPPPSES